MHEPALMHISGAASIHFQVPRPGRQLTERASTGTAVVELRPTTGRGLQDCLGIASGCRKSFIFYLRFNTDVCLRSCLSWA